jgi:hypothetical protein
MFVKTLLKSACVVAMVTTPLLSQASDEYNRYGINDQKWHELGNGYAPDTRIHEHPIRITDGKWTAVTGIMEGTFSQPMVTADGTIIPPTGKSFRIMMATIGSWKDGVMVEEWLFWDNQTFMRQIGLAE